MRVMETRQPVPIRTGTSRETNNLNEWQASVERRNEVYAAALVRAMDEGKSPDQARGIARRSFLSSFDDVPEVEYISPLAGMEVASIPKRGRRAA